ncbi:MAG: transcription-repair coupling factor [Clostridia bacterium]
MRIQERLDFEKLGGEYTKCINAIRGGISSSAFGMGKSERIHFTSCFSKRVLYIAGDYLSAKNIYNEFIESGRNACFFPAGSDILSYKHAQSNENNISRLLTLSSVLTDSTDIIVATADGLLSKLPSKEVFTKHFKIIKVGQNIEPSVITSFLSKMGYRNEGLVGSVGQFSLRGDILDVYPLNYNDTAYRIEFFDNEIDKICELDIENQSSKSTKVDSFFVCPLTNVFFDNNKSNIMKELTKIQSKTFKNAESEQSYKTIINELLSKIEQDELGFSLDYLFPLMSDRLGTLLDYMNEDDLIIIDEGKNVYDAFGIHQTEIINRFKEYLKTDEVLTSSDCGYFSFESFKKRLDKFTVLVHQKLSSANRFFEPKAVFNFKCGPMTKYTQNSALLAKDIETWHINDFKVLIFARDNNSALNVRDMLSEDNIFLDVCENATLTSKKSAIIPAELSSGFILLDSKIVVIGCDDILRKKIKQSSVTAKRKDVFSVPKIGDYVVHEIHGIGICEGTETLSGSFGTKDFVVVKYRDNDKLFVPIDQMNLLDRFSGADTPKRLSKIGGAEFASTKQKVRESIKKMAVDLLALYAERESRKGFVFASDDIMQREFEESFPYAETEDQIKSIEEIKKDMESGKVMERLLCGDVGFGKTEVALRAGFKAVLSGKQVAFLAPTTILSEQHYKTCLKRMKDFGVNIGCLNRFKTEKEKTQTLNDLKSGKLDIICGTHRLLSKDVIFNDLGLIILDEEQKFGVEDKEKLKLIKSNVDVLTLSATPIPRTLHMSMSGMRDCSIIATPPVDRIPVQTFVTEYTDTLVRDAVMREINRGGQVFIVYNRVETIYKFKQHIQSLLPPSVQIAVGHGQLGGVELEEVMRQFQTGEADILLSTTIIENGVDFQNANTLIVIDADNFGISQLYQIKGRVGRSNRMGYAYFTYDEHKVLSEDATKRLDAISEFTEFGSGFKIAMRDLEIRGGGNLLGAEQHGHMQKVGYDLYCKMLENEVAILKGEKCEEKIDTVMKISLDAFIPEKYIVDSSNRMTTYKNISRIENEKDYNSLLAETEDMFGKMPLVVRNLAFIALLKAKASRLSVVELIINSSQGKLTLKDAQTILASENIAKAVYKYNSICALELNAGCIKFAFTSPNVLENANIVKDFLNISLNIE